MMGLRGCSRFLGQQSRGRGQGRQGQRGGHRHPLCTTVNQQCRAEHRLGGHRGDLHFRRRAGQPRQHHRSLIGMCTCAGQRCRIRGHLLPCDRDLGITDDRVCARLGPSGAGLVGPHAGKRAGHAVRVPEYYLHHVGQREAAKLQKDGVDGRRRHGHDPKEDLRMDVITRV